MMIMLLALVVDGPVLYTVTELETIVVFKAKILIIGM